MEIVLNDGTSKPDADQLEGCLFSSWGKSDRSEIQCLHSTHDVCIWEIESIQTWLGAVEGRFSGRIQSSDRLIGTLHTLTISYHKFIIQTL